MSKAETLAELPNLNSEDRTQVFECLCQLQENHLLRGIGPSADERKLLDDALAEFERDGNPGRPWREVLQAVRASRATNKTAFSRTATQSTLLRSQLSCAILSSGINAFFNENQLHQMRR